MKCSFCGLDAVYFKRTSSEYFCKKCFTKYVERKFKKLIRKYGMIKKNDVIAIGVSGGKDSSVMLYLLSNILKKRSDIKYFAILIDEGIKDYRTISIKYIKDLCKRVSIPLHIFSFKKELNVTIDKVSIKHKKTCTYCGVFRRYLLNKKSREMNANKLFVGHNLDDEAESIIMNFFRGDYNRFLRLGAAPYKEKRNGFVPRYKPMLTLSEKEIMLYAILKHIPFYDGECPYSFNNVRRDTLNMLSEIEKKYPGTKQNIVKFYSRIRKSLPEWEGHIKKCRICNEPSSNEVCKSCELINTLK